MSEPTRSQPKAVSAFRKGDWVILKGEVCRIVELRWSQPGKHGKAKVLFVGKNVATGKTVEEIGKSGKTMPGVERPKQNQQQQSTTIVQPENDPETPETMATCTVLGIEPLRLIDEDNHIREDVVLPHDEALRRQILTYWDSFSRAASTEEQNVVVILDSNDKIVAAHVEAQA